MTPCKLGRTAIKPVSFVSTIPQVPKRKQRERISFSGMLSGSPFIVNNLIQNSKKQFVESKTIQNNKDKFFKHGQSLFSIDSISGFINEKGSYYNTPYYTRRVLDFLNYLLCDNTKFYERIPINVIIEE